MKTLVYESPKARFPIGWVCQTKGGFYRAYAAPGLGYGPFFNVCDAIGWVKRSAAWRQKR